MLPGPNASPFQAHRCNGLGNSSGFRSLNACKANRLKHTRQNSFKSQSRRKQKQLRVERLRCHAGKDLPEGNLKKFLDWGKKILQNFTPEAQAQKSKKTEEEPVTSQVDENPNLQEETAKPVAKQKEKPAFHLSTISRYDSKTPEAGEKRTRSSIGRDSVRINAKEGAMSKLSNTNAQKSYFDRVINAAAKKEQAEKELKKRKRNYRHLSRKREITHDWPKSDEPSWEQWEEIIYASDEAVAFMHKNRKGIKDHTRVGAFGSAADLMKEIRAMQDHDKMAQIIKGYNKALEMQDYKTAAHLRDSGGLGLVGWWWASSGSHAGNRPHLLRVSPGHNRLIFRALSPMDLGLQQGIFKRWPQNGTEYYPAVDDGQNLVEVPSEDFSKEDVNQIEENADAEILPDKYAASVVAELHVMSNTEEEILEKEKNPASVGTIKSQATAFNRVLPHGEQNWGIPQNAVARLETDSEGKTRLIVDVDVEGFGEDEGSDSDSEIEDDTEDEDEEDTAQENSKSGNLLLQSEEMQTLFKIFQSQNENVESPKENLLQPTESSSQESEKNSKSPVEDSKSTVENSKSAVEGLQSEEKAEEPEEKKNDENEEAKEVEAVLEVKEATVESPEDVKEESVSNFDSQEIEERKGEMLKSINVHHNLDSSKDVPILHIFLTAEKEKLDAYKATQNQPSSANFLPGGKSGGDVEEPLDEETRTLGFQEAQQALAAIQQGTIVEERVAVERVPADITRFQGDNDRFMLSVFPSEEEEAASEEAEEENGNKPDPNAGQDSQTALKSGEAALLQNQEQMQNLVRQFVQANGLDPNEISIDLMKTLEDTGVISANSSQEATSSTDMMEPYLPNLMHQEMEYIELKGTVQYKRLPRDMPKTDPFSGVYLKCSWLEGNLSGLEVLQLERRKQGQADFVVARMITMADPHRNGKILFRAFLGRNQKLEPRWYYHPHLQVTARYRAQTWSEIENDSGISGRWIDGGELVEFSETNSEGFQTAKLGYVPDASYGDVAMSLLNRLDLDDPMDGDHSSDD